MVFGPKKKINCESNKNLFSASVNVRDFRVVDLIGFLIKIKQNQFKFIVTLFIKRNEDKRFRERNFFPEK